MNGRDLIALDDSDVDQMWCVIPPLMGEIARKKHASGVISRLLSELLLP